MRRWLPGLALLVLAATVAGWHSGRLASRLDRDRDARADAAMRKRLLKEDLPAQGRFSAVVAAERLGHWVALPRSPLEAMAAGVAPTQENGRQLTLVPFESWAIEPGESALFLREMHLDPALVIVALVPIVILFGPLLKLPVLAPAIVVASVAAWLATGAGLASGEGWWRWLLWTVAAVASGWFWSGVRQWCDRHPEPERAGVAAYITLVMALPCLLSVLTTVFLPTPSAAESVAAIRQEVSAQAREDSARLANFHEAHPDLIDGADTSEYDRVRLDALEKTRQKAAAILERDRAARRRERVANDVLRLLSPVSALHGALLEAAGTSGGRAADFRAQLDGFLTATWEPFFAVRARKADGFTAADLGQVPEFRYQAESPAAAMGRAGVPLLLVIGFGFLFRRLRFNLPN